MIPAFFLAWEHAILNIMSGPWGPGEVHCPVWGVTQLRMKNKLGLSCAKLRLSLASQLGKLY
jgi:hypothetical protein